MQKQQKGGCKEHPDPGPVQCPRMGGNGHKVKHSIFCLNIWKQFLAVSVTEHRQRLPRNTFWKISKSFSRSFLEIFKSSLDMVPSTGGKRSCFSRTIGPDALPKVPSHLNLYSCVYFLYKGGESDNKYDKVTLSQYACLNNKFQMHSKICIGYRLLAWGYYHLVLN